MAVNKVLFARGLSTTFSSLTKDANTLYFLTDTQEIYLGPDRVGFGQSEQQIGVTVSGTGDCVTFATYNSSTNQLTLTLGTATTDIASISTALSSITAQLGSFVESVSAVQNTDAIKVDNTDSKNPKIKLNIAPGDYAGNVLLSDTAAGLRGSVTLPTVTAATASAIEVTASTDSLTFDVGLNIASGAAAGNVALGQTADGLMANVTIPVTGVKSGEKVISLDGTEIKSDLTVKTAQHDSKTWVQLVGASNQVVSEFDAAAFIKDGMLDTVALEDGTGTYAGKKVLHFVFNADASKQDIYVDVTSLVNTYSAATNGGLSLNASKEFSINNTVTAGKVLNAATLAFGSSTVIPVAKFDSHGLVTGMATTTIALPSVPTGATGSVGASDGSKVVTYASLSVGSFNGTAVDIINVAPTTTPASTEVVSSAALFDAMAMWSTFSTTPVPPPTPGTGYIEFIANTRFKFTPGSESGPSSAAWDGDIEYSYDGQTWDTLYPLVDIWSFAEDTEIHKLYLRGTNNSYLTKVNYEDYKIEFESYSGITPELSVNGNIENLLDYQVVAQGGHPQMDEYCFANFFSFIGEYLISAPSLPAVTLSDFCYQNMFAGCSSLTTAPALPATTLADGCYSGMFSECSSLTSAPTLPATTLAAGCYRTMFAGCSSLVTIPALPATVLADSCYEEMFSYCDLLDSLPELLATTLADSCYLGMFHHSNNIKLSEVQTAVYQTAYRIPMLGTGVTATNALSQMFASTGGTFTSMPSINTTYYTSNTVIPANS